MPKHQITNSPNHAFSKTSLDIQKKESKIKEKRKHFEINNKRITKIFER
jgi:hypothetical protein